MNRPNEIRRILEIVFQVLSGIFEFLTIFLPMKIPNDINISWNIEASTGKYKFEKPPMLLPIPMQTESRASATPEN